MEAIKTRFLVPVYDCGVITELAREVLRGATLDDLQSLFADEIRVSNSPLGSPTEVSSVLLPVKVKTWMEWAANRRVSREEDHRGEAKRRYKNLPGQLSIWANKKED